MADKEESLDMPEVAQGTITLTSKDGVDFVVARASAYISVMIKTTMENDKDAGKMPVPYVESVTLKEVVAYMEHHKGVSPAPVEKPLRDKVMARVCKDPWDAEFIDRIGADRRALYNLILAANYLDIKSLLHLGAAKVASLVKGEPFEKIKDLLDPEKHPGGQPAA